MLRCFDEKHNLLFWKIHFSVGLHILHLQECVDDAIDIEYCMFHDKIAACE